jgi:Arc/MetJ-type ribon-helix-helix transcriptional regulator
LVHHDTLDYVATKKKTVISAERDHLREIQRLIGAGDYRTVSEFVREAVGEKLERIRDTRLRGQVARYVDAGLGQEDDDLVASQALPSRKRNAKS